MSPRITPNIIGELLTWPVGILAALMPRRARTLVFGARSGFDFTDCSAVIFQRMSNLGWHCVWLSRDPEIVGKVRADGLKGELIGTASASWVLNRAWAVVISSQLADVAIHPCLVRADVRFVFTGHGKSTKLSYLGALYHRDLDKPSRSWQFVRKRVRIAFAPSPLKKQQIVNSYGFDPGLVAITGMPRHDILFERAAAPRIPGPYRILYAPTWRKPGVLPQTKLFGYSDFDPRALVQILELHDLELILRPHGQDMNQDGMMDQLSVLTALSPRITVADARSERLSDVLQRADILLTDYSSIDDDFLVFDRPVIYVPYDLQEFEEKQGFGEPYASSRAGPIAKSFCELGDLLAQVRREGDIGQSDRRFRRSLVHPMLDGQATARAIGVIEANLLSANSQYGARGPNDPNACADNVK